MILEIPASQSHKSKITALDRPTRMGLALRQRRRAGRVGTRQASRQEGRYAATQSVYGLARSPWIAIIRSIRSSGEELRANAASKSAMYWRLSSIWRCASSSAACGCRCPAMILSASSCATASRARFQLALDSGVDPLNHMWVWL